MFSTDPVDNSVDTAIEFRPRQHGTLVHLKLTIFLPIPIFSFISYGYDTIVSREMHFVEQLAIFPDTAALLCITDLLVDSNTPLTICSPSVRK